VNHRLEGILGVVIHSVIPFPHGVRENVAVDFLVGENLSAHTNEGKVAIRHAHLFGDQHVLPHVHPRDGEENDAGVFADRLENLPNFTVRHVEVDSVTGRHFVVAGVHDVLDHGLSGGSELLPGIVDDRVSSPPEQVVQGVDGLRVLVNWGEDPHQTCVPWSLVVVDFVVVLTVIKHGDVPLATELGQLLCTFSA